MVCVHLFLACENVRSLLLIALMWMKVHVSSVIFNKEDIMMISSVCMKFHSSFLYNLTIMICEME